MAWRGLPRTRAWAILLLGLAADATGGWDEAAWAAGNWPAKRAGNAILPHAHGGPGGHPRPWIRRPTAAKFFLAGVDDRQPRLKCTVLFVADVRKACFGGGRVDICVYQHRRGPRTRP